MIGRSLIGCDKTSRAYLPFLRLLRVLWLVGLGMQRPYDLRVLWFRSFRIVREELANNRTKGLIYGNCQP